MRLCNVTVHGMSFYTHCGICVLCADGGFVLVSSIVGPWHTYHIYIYTYRASYIYIYIHITYHVSTNSSFQ